MTSRSTLRSHGFSVNLEKSHLTPTTRLLHQGAVIDYIEGRVYLSQEHQVSLVSVVDRILWERKVSLLLLQLLGKMISAISTIPWARIHAQNLQWFLLPFQKAGRVTSSAKIQVSKDFLRSLKWWRSPALTKGCLFHRPQQLVVTMDTSLSDWGAHFQSWVAQGRWSTCEQRWNISWLELRAVYLVFRQFQGSLSGKHILVLMDNVATKAHINRQGGTKSKSLMLKARRLGLWAERHLGSLTAEHIFRVFNVQVDWLSWQAIDHSEWHMHSLFRDLTA